MILTRSELYSLFSLNNLVILKPEIDTSTIEYGSARFYMPLSLADGKPYDIFKTQPIVCSVVSTPKRLIFGKRKIFWETIDELDIPAEQKIMLHKHRIAAKFSETTLIDAPIPGSMRWKTTVQVKQNDIVWVNSSSLMKAEQVNMTLECDKQLYYIVPYESLYFKKKGDKVQMLNGWVLAEMVDTTKAWIKSAEKSGIIIPASYKINKYKDRMGIVRYIGDPVEYLFEDDYDHPDINIGDVIMFKWKVNRRLEPGNKYFAKDKDLIVTRRTNIMAVLK